MKLPSGFLCDARRMLGRIHYTRSKIPIQTHILATLDARGITLAVADGGHWLETRTEAPPEPCEAQTFLIPVEAMAAAIRADKGTSVTFTPRGPCKRRELRLTAVCGGIQGESVHPTLDAGEFVVRPVIEGTCTTVPARTMESLAVVAGCASTEPTRPLLNGVLFNPEEGGHLIATNGRLLANTPAVVPSQKFILPNAAAHVLAHPDFTGREVEVTLPRNPDDLRAAFRSGNHLLITTIIAGDYPNFREAIPADVPELVTIAGERRPAVIAWLRSLPDTGAVLHLTWEKRGQLTLTHRSRSSAAAVLRVPVEIQGNPPLIAFNPRLLADALEIGSTLCLRDSLTPGICRHPGGRFCVIMPLRCEFTPEEIARSTRASAEHAA